MTAPVVSVVIPVFNGAEELSGAIDSALDQRDCDLEVIVVDDGSTDGTDEVIRSYGERIRCVRPVGPVPAGAARARNDGVAQARGDWIAFLDHDDVWLSGKLGAQLELADRKGVDVVYTNARNFGDVGRVAELRSDPAAMPEGDVFEALLLDNFITTSSVIVRRATFDAVGGFNEDPALVEDWDLWIEAAASGARFAAVRDPMVLYRWRPGSLSRNYERLRLSRMATIEKALSSPRGRALPWSVRRRALASVEICSAWFLAGSAPRKAIRWYVRSLVYWPFDLGAWKAIAKGCMGRS